MNCKSPCGGAVGCRAEGRLFFRLAENGTITARPGEGVRLIKDDHTLTGEIAQGFLLGHGQHPSVG